MPAITSSPFATITDTTITNTLSGGPAGSAGSVDGVNMTGGLIMADSSFIPLTPVPIAAGETAAQVAAKVAAAWDALADISVAAQGTDVVITDNSGKKFNTMGAAAGLMALNIDGTQDVAAPPTPPKPTGTQPAPGNAPADKVPSINVPLIQGAYYDNLSYRMGSSPKLYNNSTMAPGDDFDQFKPPWKGEPVSLFWTSGKNK